MVSVTCEFQLYCIIKNFDLYNYFLVTVVPYKILKTSFLLIMHCPHVLMHTMELIQFLLVKFIMDCYLKYLERKTFYYTLWTFWMYYLETVELAKCLLPNVDSFY